MQKIRAPLLERLNEGKLVDIAICVKVLEKLDRVLLSPECTDQEDELDTEAEQTAFLDKSLAAVVEFLEKEKIRLFFTWKRMSESSTIIIIVNGADRKLVEDIAAIDFVDNVDEYKVVEVKSLKPWNRLKSMFNRRK